jgi:hypothetical protein
MILMAAVLVVGAAPAGASALIRPSAHVAPEETAQAFVQLAQSRRDIRRERRDLAEERRELRRAQRSGDQWRVRRERRDVRDARRDLRDARRDFHRRYYVRDGRRYYRTPSGAEVFAGIVAGAIAAGAANAAARNQETIAYCAQRYRSYDPASGTYLGHDGRRHPCP